MFRNFDAFHRKPTNYFTTETIKKDTENKHD
jgi:hypothetical protein